jgi:hypothetical protein
VWSFALLFGNPISGALLQAPHYFWSRAIVFNAVRCLYTSTDASAADLPWYLIGDGAVWVLFVGSDESNGSESERHSVRLGPRRVVIFTGTVEVWVASFNLELLELYSGSV